MLAGPQTAGRRLTDSVIQRKVNHAARADLMIHMQRGAGNHFVQRALGLALNPEEPQKKRCSCGGTCADCVQAFASGAPAAAPYDFSPPATSGHTLPGGTRERMESHYGSDFGDVRVHTDDDASKSAQSIGALAYTTDRDIYFAGGMYSPSSTSGQRLLAHELAHVVQQANGAHRQVLTARNSRGSVIAPVDDPLEVEAEQAAGAVVDEGKKVRIAGQTGSGVTARAIQRYPDGGAPIQDAGVPAPPIQDAGAPPVVIPDSGVPTPSPSDSPADAGAPPDGDDGSGLREEQLKRLIVARAILSKVPKLWDEAKADFDKALPAAAIKQQMAVRDAKADRLRQATEEVDNLRPSAGMPDDATEGQIEGLGQEIDTLNREIPALNASIFDSLNDLRIPGDSQQEKEENLITFVTETFPTRFEIRAKQIVSSELDENAKLAEAEFNRYSNAYGATDDPAAQRTGMICAARPGIWSIRPQALTI